MLSGLLCWMHSLSIFVSSFWKRALDSPEHAAKVTKAAIQSEICWHKAWNPIVVKGDLKTLLSGNKEEILAGLCAAVKAWKNPSHQDVALPGRPTSMDDSTVVTGDEDERDKLEDELIPS